MYFYNIYSIYYIYIYILCISIHTYMNNVYLYINAYNVYAKKSVYIMLYIITHIHIYVLHIYFHVNTK